MAVTDWEELRQVAQAGFSDAMAAAGSIEVVERSNRPTVIEPLEDRDAGRAAKLLVDAALFRVHIFAVRAFDAPFRTGDDLNLRAAIDFLRPAGRIDQAPAHRRPDLALAVARFDEADADPRLPPLRLMRNKLLAHVARYDVGGNGPTYNDLFGFTGRVGLIWEALSNGAGIHTLTLASQIAAYTESAEAFWSVWEGKPRP